MRRKSGVDAARGGRAMKRFVLAVVILFISSLAGAQINRIVIAAGTPEDQALTAINAESDAGKKVAMYEDFVQKFSANPAAVAYGNWQLAQYYQGTGDLQKAMDYGEKAAAGSPHNLDILNSQVQIAQQLKDNQRAFKYAVQGGQAYDSIEKQPKPADTNDEQFASLIASQKEQ